MARLQILELPEGSGDDRPPFVLVVDEVSYPTVEAHLTAEAWWQNLAQQIGARGCIVTDDSIDIPANDTTAYLKDSGIAEMECVLKVGDQDVRKAVAADVQKMRDSHNDGLNVRDKDAELRAASEWIERLTAERGEARIWARHGYEIGQRHCGWTDHGVAPGWLTEGWPASFDSCEHLVRASEYDEALTRVRAEVARIRSITPTWGPVADLLDAALNRDQHPAERATPDA